MTTGRVCVVGSINVDTTYRVPVLPGHGETILATGRSSSPGGKGANQAVAAATLGSQVRFIGAVGSDDNAGTGLGALTERGIDTTGVRQLEETPTGTAIVVVAADGENLIIVDPAANDHVDAAWVGEAIGDCSQEIVLAQLEVPIEGLLAAAEAGPSRLVLNPAPARAATELAELLAHVDVLVPNRAELGQLAGRPTPTTLAEVSECAAALDFAGSLVVTLGRDGAVIIEPGGQVVEQVPAPTIEAADTSGAGDAFCGVLAHELARDASDLAGAVRRAVALASTSTRYPGAQVPATFGVEQSA
ncbi:ribokinase [Ornithinimicrobium faecis]|uniref:Ribokinase n=1 Tax=Ornithinimicrobium faecis TaxID=2934158 RepID=A0ABY4YRK0_9MICO|nr:ribokinase [Ornithinimicrobium sp. HY1793]USQ79140.1 ribokinase [Ornithinimicrobium sp. HY1793]